MAQPLPTQTWNLGLLDVLKLAGFDSTVRTKLVRHQGGRYSVRDLRRNEDWFELYQSYQRRPVFGKADQIVSFYGLPGTRAGFYGVYEVRGQRPGSQGPVRKSCPWSHEWNRDAGVFYDLRRDKRFDSLRDRLIIDWGPGTRKWVQNLATKPNKPDKPVLEIQEAGRQLPPFDDYLEFSLSYAQLQDLFHNAEAHRDWRAALSAVAGVYVILAETSGDLYVGSASGEDGIWGRWCDYATAPDGGNKALRKLIERDPADYPEKFRFSLLQILPKTMSQKEVCEREAKFKVKLGTRTTGLNA